MSACSSKIAEWGSDYDVALVEAKAQGKGVLLLMSGDEWDGLSPEAKSKIFYTSAFQKKMSKDYVLVNIDFPQIPEDKTFDDFDDTVKENFEIAQHYSTQTFPTLYVLANNGYVIKEIEYAYVNLPDAKNIIKQIEQVSENCKNVNKAADKLETATGIDRVDCITQIFNNAAISHRIMFTELFAEAVELDPENTKGMRGTYNLQLAYTKASQDFAERQFNAAIDRFLGLLETEALTPEQIQEVYYNAAWISSMSESFDKTVVTTYLQKAFDACPEAEGAGDLLTMIQNINNPPYSDENVIPEGENAIEVYE
jgi:thioredoxin-related protein